MEKKSVMHQVAEIKDLNPNLSTTDLATKLGCSRQAVYDALKKLGLPSVSKWDLRPAPANKKPVFTPLFENLSPYQAAAVSEMVVATEMLLRGFDIYKSVTSAGMCDLVAINRSDEKITRIEVKTARKTPSGKYLHSPARKNKYDILALVFPDKSIKYITKSGDDWDFEQFNNL